MKTDTNHKARWTNNQHLALESLRDTLCKLSGAEILTKLKAIESTASRYATAECNGENTPEGWEEKLTERVKKVFGRVPTGFFINGDPRGYALKIDNEKGIIPEGMQKDWGGYGLLAPKI